MRRRIVSNVIQAMQSAPHELVDVQRVSFEASRDAIVQLDEDGNVLHANEAAFEVSELVSALLARWRSDPEVHAFRVELRARGCASMELHVDHAINGVRSLSMHARTLGTTAVVLLRDVSDAALVMREVSVSRISELELQELRGAATAGRFVTSLLHDLRNLVTPTSILSEALAHEVPSGSRGAQMVAELQLAVQQTASLVEQLRAFVRREPRPPQRVDIASVVKEVAPIVERLSGEAVELVLSVDAAAGETLVDRVEFERVILNLVANARDAMPHGGRITLRTHLVILDAAHAEKVSCPGAGAYVVLSVADEGTGMTDAVRARAFDALFSTKAHGSGLGLASARAFAERHGGGIHLRSELGEGTIVSLYLPCVSEAEEEPMSDRSSSRMAAIAQSARRAHARCA